MIVKIYKRIQLLNNDRDVAIKRIVDLECSCYDVSPDPVDFDYDALIIMPIWYDRPFLYKSDRKYWLTSDKLVEVDPYVPFCTGVEKIGCDGQWLKADPEQIEEPKLCREVLCSYGDDVCYKDSLDDQLFSMEDDDMEDVPRYGVEQFPRYDTDSESDHVFSSDEEEVIFSSRRRTIAENQSTQRYWADVFRHMSLEEVLDDEEPDFREPSRSYDVAQQQWWVYQGSSFVLYPFAGQSLGLGLEYYLFLAQAVTNAVQESDVQATSAVILLVFTFFALVGLNLYYVEKRLDFKWAYQ